MSSMMDAPVRVSRLAVGSSARTRDGRLTSARAIATLALPAAELVRPLVAPVGQPDGLQHVHHACTPLGTREAEHQQRIFDILIRRQHRDQIEALEHETDVAAAKIRQPVVGHLADILPAHLDPAGVRPVDASDQIEQRGLAAAGRPDHHAEMARGDGQADIGQCRHADAPGQINPADPIEPHDRRVGLQRHRAVVFGVHKQFGTLHVTIAIL
jgi:hypothetical protein